MHSLRFTNNLPSQTYLKRSEKRGLFVLGQILTSQDSAHTSQQLDRQIAISEEQLEQSKLTNELLEERIRLLQSIDDSIDQLMEARDIPVQDVHPSNETQDHPTE